MTNFDMRLIEFRVAQAQVEFGRLADIDTIMVEIDFGIKIGVFAEVQGLEGRQWAEGIGQELTWTTRIKVIIIIYKF